MIMLAASLFLVACTDTSEQSSAPSVSSSTTKPTTTSSTSSSSAATAPTFSSEVTALLKKGASTTNYQYSFQGSVRNNNENYEQTTVPNIYIKDNLQKKSWVNPQKYERNLNYDNIYLESVQSTATAICASLSALSCEGLENKAFKVEFAPQEVVYLHKLVTNLPADTKVVGEEVLNSRNCLILEYAINSEKKERLSIDKYYGLPLQRVLYVIENEEQINLEKDSYKIISVNTVKTSDVTLPEGYAFI